METKKTSKKSIKTVESPSAESKPVKRAPAKRAVTPSSPSEPKNTSHRHSKPSPVATEPSMNYEEVARLAYKYWEERNYANGSAEEDWDRAERALSAAGR